VVGRARPLDPPAVRKRDARPPMSCDTLGAYRVRNAGRRPTGRAAPGRADARQCVDHSYQRAQPPGAQPPGAQPPGAQPPGAQPPGGTASTGRRAPSHPRERETVAAKSGLRSLKRIRRSEARVRRCGSSHALRNQRAGHTATVRPRVLPSVRRPHGAAIHEPDPSTHRLGNTGRSRRRVVGVRSAEPDRE
jgi:hypothetical protein